MDQKNGRVRYNQRVITKTFGEKLNKKLAKGEK